MAHYIEIIDGVVANVVLCHDDAWAKEQGLEGPIDEWHVKPAIGWRRHDVGFIEPPPVPLTAQEAAANDLQTIAAEHMPTFLGQIEQDIATLTTTQWGSLDSTQQHNMMLRVINGFGAILEAIQAHAIATGTLPPQVIASTIDATTATIIAGTPTLRAYATSGTINAGMPSKR